MRSIKIEITREDSLIQVENWPQAVEEVGTVSDSVNDGINHEDNVLPIGGPICKDGVCQLGAWKPRKTA